MRSNHQSQKFIKHNSKGKYLKVSKYHHYLKQCDVTKIFFKSLVFLYFLLLSLMAKDLISQFCSSINIFLKCIILFYLLFSKKFTWMEIPNISKSAKKLRSWIWRFMTLLDIRLIKKPNKCAAGADTDNKNRVDMGKQNLTNWCMSLKWSLIGINFYTRITLHYYQG